MLTWISKFIAGEFIKNELEKVKIEIKNELKELVKQIVKDAMEEMNKPK